MVNRLECEICGVSIKGKGYLRRHYRVVHKKDNPELLGI